MRFHIFRPSSNRKYDVTTTMTSAYNASAPTVLMSGCLGALSGYTMSIRWNFAVVEASSATGCAAATASAV